MRFWISGVLFGVSPCQENLSGISGNTHCPEFSSGEGVTFLRYKSFKMWSSHNSVVSEITFDSVTS